MTVHNGTTQQLDGSQFISLGGSPSVTYGSMGEQANFGRWEGWVFPKMGTLLPGDTQTTKVGYYIPPADQDAVRVAFDVPHYLSPTPAVFKGAVK